MTSDDDKKSTKGWKEHLLRSGVPLEYQVALIMTSEGMTARADFSFLRRDLSGSKECSVDIDSTWYGPTSNILKFELHVLVECKYRSPDKVVLFFEEPNDPDFSPVTLGGTVSYFDTFVPYHLPLNAFVSLEQDFPFVYKGVEVFERGAVEEDLRHGIQQLRYATPAFLRSILDAQLFGNFPSEATALFFSRILVTNAPLLLLRRGLGVEDIKTASSIQDVSTPVDTVILFSDYGPDFEDHVRSAFQSDLDSRLERAGIFTEYLKGEGKKFRFRDNPIELLQSLAMANRFECKAISTQFFVTTLTGLLPLLRELKESCKNSYRNRSKRRRRSS